MAQAVACPMVRSTRAALSWCGPLAPSGTAAKPLRAAPPPRANWLSTRPSAASFCLAFRLCPSLSLRVSAVRRRCAACSQPVGKRADGRRPGAFEARRLHGGRLRRMLRKARRQMRKVGARTARTTTRQQPERHARWHDERHDNVQRIGGHHGRVSSQTGCAMPITADALTGPK